MCEKPEPPINIEITEGQERIVFSDLFDKLQAAFSGDDKPTPPPNTTTTRDGGGGDRPAPPPNQEITKGE